MCRKIQPAILLFANYILQRPVITLAPFALAFRFQTIPDGKVLHNNRECPFIKV